MPIKLTAEERPWYRTCQECGHRQKAHPQQVGQKVTTAYANSKCRKCHSMALDYGSYESTDEWADD